MKKIALVFIATLILNGCATFHTPLPKGYSGPTSVINDTANRIDSGKADFFYLSHIDGKKIEHSRIKSRKRSYGRGDNLEIILQQNSVPAKEHVFTIVGRTDYAMPMRALSGKVFNVKGDVKFSPQENEQYEIKGNLSEAKSEVWIERVSNGEVIEKFEVEGSSTLGFFEK